MRKWMLLGIALFSMAAQAELPKAAPETVCQYLADIALKGRKWVPDYGDGTSGCATDYKDIGTGAPLANNLAYYATGKGGKVDQLKLVLNYNQPKSAGFATASLISAAQKLSPKALGASLPPEVIQLIKAGRSGKAKVGTGEVEVLRDNWPTGRGYEVQVMMR